MSEIDWKAVKAEIEELPWEACDHDPDLEERQVYIGTVFTLLPSARYYQPWACSNLEPCRACGGLGSWWAGRKTRLLVGKRKRATLAARRRGHDPFATDPTPRGQRVRRYVDRLARIIIRHAGNLTGRVTCSHCDGLGSAEAAADARWWEENEALAESMGLSICCGDGDPCDLFAVETRDVEEGAVPSAA